MSPSTFGHGLEAHGVKQRRYRKHPGLLWSHCSRPFSFSLNSDLSLPKNDLQTQMCIVLNLLLIYKSKHSFWSISLDFEGLLLYVKLAGFRAASCSDSAQYRFVTIQFSSVSNTTPRYYSLITAFTTESSLQIDLRSTKPPFHKFPISMTFKQCSIFSSTLAVTSSFCPPSPVSTLPGCSSRKTYFRYITTKAFFFFNKATDTGTLYHQTYSCGGRVK